MSDLVWIIFVFFLMLLFVVQEGIMLQCMRRNMGLQRKKYALFVLCSIFNVLWSLEAAVKGMSILALLSGLFLSFFISLIPLYKDYFNWIRFCQMKFVVFTSAVLIFLGIACLFGSSVEQVSIIREVRLFVLLGAKVAEIIYTLIYKKNFEQSVEGKEQDKKKMGVFQGFLLFCLAYIYADGVLAIYDFGEDFVPALMISGNALLLVLMFGFYRFDYVMEQKEQLEKERQELEEEKARKQWKTEQLKAMAEKDALTKAYSRGYFIEKAENMKKEHVPFLMIYIDMDNMKEINDTRGHHAGDDYLKNFVTELAGRLRKDDFVARIGGDEFLAILYQCSEENGRRRMEQISGSLPEYSFSYGIAAGGTSVAEMIEEADSNMYDVKKQKGGRDHR